MAVQKQSTANRNTVVAVYHSHADAQAAIRDLKSAGFSEDRLGIAAQDREGTFQDQTDGNKSGAGAAVGATAGFGAGALWGLGIVAGVLPAIGPVIAGGALAAIAASAAGTAATGGIVGAMIGLGIPEEEAEYYRGEFERGRTIFTVKASGADADKASRIMDSANAYDYDRRESNEARNLVSSARRDMDGNVVQQHDTIGSSHRM